MSKYHVNINGYIALCGANINSCPRKSGGHFTQEQVDAFEAEGDPRIETTFKATPNSYYSQAKAEYEAASKDLAAEAKVEQDIKDYSKNLFTEAGISPKEALNASNNAVIARDEALSRLQQLYVEEGVHPSKAFYLTEDIRKKTGNNTTPIVRKKDKFDTNIGEKTQKAADRAKQDPEFVAKSAEAQRLTEVADANTKIFLATANYRRAKQIDANGRPKLSSFYNASERLVKATTNLKKANNWKTSGIPDEAKLVATSTLKAENLSTDKDGSINNAWVDLGDGSVERITSYSPRPENAYSGSGQLVTETGKTVSQNTHYHSFRKDTSGVGSIIIGAKTGKEFTPKSFSITSSLDTGD